MLNTGMSAYLVFGTEDAVDFGYFLAVGLVPIKIDLN